MTLTLDYPKRIVKIRKDEEVRYRSFRGHANVSLSYVAGAFIPGEAP